MDIFFFNKETLRSTIVAEEEISRRGSGRYARLVADGYAPYEISVVDDEPVLVPMKTRSGQSVYREVLVEVGLERKPGYDSVPAAPSRRSPPSRVRPIVTIEDGE